MSNWEGVIRIGRSGGNSPRKNMNICNLSWRHSFHGAKGPFEIFRNLYRLGMEKRPQVGKEVVPVLDSLQGKRVADIGCNNGYYMFRMAAHHPELVIGFDPTVRALVCLSFLATICTDPPLCNLNCWVSNTFTFSPLFLTLFFVWGILYHHSDSHWNPAKNPTRDENQEGN